jgi:drug/metabolite transporter (DMT)-like permease
MMELGPVCSFLSSVTWAIGSAGYSRLSRGHSPFAVNFARATVALPLYLTALVVVSGGPAAGWGLLIHAPAEQIMWFALSILASYGLGDVFFMWSTRSLGVPAALAIGSTYPLLTAGAGALIQGETLSVLQCLGLLLTVAGIVVVILSGKDDPSVVTAPSSEGAHAAPAHLTSRKLGVLLAFGTMVMWALNSVASARVKVDPLVANTYRMALGLAMSAGFSRVIAPGTEIVMPWRVIRGALPVFVAEALFGSFFFVYGLSHSSLALGSTLASLAPILAVPVSIALRLERFSLVRTVAVCVVVLGLWLLVGAF